jgi:hypothetical protein
MPSAGVHGTPGLASMPRGPHGAAGRGRASGREAARHVRDAAPAFTGTSMVAPVTANVCSERGGPALAGVAAITRRQLRRAYYAGAHHMFATIIGSMVTDAGSIDVFANEFERIPYGGQGRASLRRLGSKPLAGSSDARGNFPRSAECSIARVRRRSLRLAAAPRRPPPPAPV